jgi:hypothetical protein
MTRKLAVVAVVFLCAMRFAPPAAARQPEAAAWRLLEAPREGVFRPGPTPGGDTQILIGLHPSDDQFKGSPLLVVFPGCGEDPATGNSPILNLEEVLKSPDARVRRPEAWEDPGPRWRLCPSEQAVLLHGQEQGLKLALDFLRASDEGLSPRLAGEIHILSERDLEQADHDKDPAALAKLVGRRSPAAHLDIDLFYRLDARREAFFMGGYHDVFGAPTRDMLQFAQPTGDHAKLASELPVDLLSFRSTLRIPRHTEDDRGRLFKQTLRNSVGSDLVGAPICGQEDYAMPGVAGAPGAADETGPVAYGVIATYNLSGRFSTRWSADHSLHPGFGFRVEAWTNDAGFWVKLGSDWVQSNGNWSLTIPPTPFFMGNRLRVYYTTSNSYYIAQDINGNGYAWVDPDWLAIPTTFSTGHRYADTDGGAYNGVGEMVDAAMHMWSRLYWNGGLNPVRTSPINLIAPNTGLACGGMSPWSCASGQNIWLISAHASQAAVVSHELGHQLNYKFWNGRRPANAGGSHSSGSCYPGREGMTLLEGFADFIAGWVGYQGRNVAEGGFGSGRWALNWDLEQRTAPPSCTNGWENELWVARTFWDLHDTRSDGNDILWFNNLGAVPALYLGNGIASDGDYRDMTFYETIYRNAASPGHQGFITDIFNQNRH